MITGVAVHDIEVVDLVEVVFGGIGREDGRHARVETAAQDGRQTGSLETILVSPLPRILEVSLVLGFVVGRIEVVAAALETGVHDRQVLIRERHIDHDVGLEGPEEFAQLRHVVGIDLGGLYAVASDSRSNGIAFGLGSAGQHHLREDRIGGNLLGHDRSDTSGSDNQCFTHRSIRFKSEISV